MIRKGFWMVWGTTLGETTGQYLSKTEAENKVTQLAAKYRGTPFYVLRAERRCYLAPLEPTWTTLTYPVNEDDF